MPVLLINILKVNTEALCSKTEVRPQYVAPAIKVVEFRVERGFAASPLLAPPPENGINTTTYDKGSDVSWGRQFGTPETSAYGDGGSIW